MNKEWKVLATFGILRLPLSTAPLSGDDGNGERERTQSERAKRFRLLIFVQFLMGNLSYFYQLRKFFTQKFNAAYFVDHKFSRHFYISKSGIDTNMFIYKYTNVRTEKSERDINAVFFKFILFSSYIGC